MQMDTSLKFTAQPMRAGFPNAASDAVFTKLDLHTKLIKRPSSTYFMSLDGRLLPKQYEPTQTMVIVDRSLSMQSGDIIVVAIRGEMVLKQYKKVKGRNWLLPVVDEGKAIEFAYDEQIEIWGVVLHMIESFRHPRE